MKAHLYSAVHCGQSIGKGTKIECMNRIRIPVGRSEDVLRSVSSAFTLAQLPLMLTLISYYKDPFFAMYTTNLRNTTNTKEIDIEVEDFSASVLYLLGSVSAAIFAMTSRKVELGSDIFYTVDTLEEMPMWDLCFWATMILQHACIVTFMCSPLDWYFLALTVTGISLMIMLLSRLPLVPSGRSRENILMLLCACYS